jgi:hypothetical protein
LALWTGGGATASPAMPPDLPSRAEAEGSVRVVLELKVGPEGIRAAQDAVLQALTGTPHRVTRRFTAIPFLALELSPQALRRLAAVPAVVRIEEDRLYAPQGTSP